MATNDPGGHVYLYVHCEIFSHLVTFAPLHIGAPMPTIVQRPHTPSNPPNYYIYIYIGVESGVENRGRQGVPFSTLFSGWGALFSARKGLCL